MEKESKKNTITREKIVCGLKGEAKHAAILGFALAFLFFLVFLFFINITEFKFNLINIAVIALFGAIPLLFASRGVFCIVRMVQYGTDKLIIAEDKLYKTIPYERMNRMASSKYTRYYDHGLYFKEYGKFTVTSTSLSIDFDGNSDYSLVVFNSKKPKILEIYEKSEYEYKQ